MTNNIDRLARLCELQQLKDGFADGYGTAISVDAVSVAGDLLEDFEKAGFPTPAIFATEDGTVNFEWSFLELNEFWAIEVLEDGTAVECHWLDLNRDNALSADKKLLNSKTEVLNADEAVGFFRARATVIGFELNPVAETRK